MRSILLTIALYFTCSLNAASIHAFLVCDTNAFNLEASTTNDYYALKGELEKMEHFTDMTLQLHSYLDEKANSQFIHDLIDLEVDEDDVVIFYWSGHGINDTSAGGLFPQLNLSEGEQNKIPHHFISEIIMAKNPRLILVIADTCNRYPIKRTALNPRSSYILRDKNIKPAQFNKEAIKAAYRNLLIKSSGTYLISSSSPGQYSKCTPKGGLFTKTFIDSLQYAVCHDSEDASWEALLAETIDKVESDEYHEEIPQTPQMSLISHRL